jgi:hypothetical protein
LVGLWGGVGWGGGGGWGWWGWWWGWYRQQGEWVQCTS